MSQVEDSTVSLLSELVAVEEWVDLGQVRAFTSALVAVLTTWMPDAD